MVSTLLTITPVAPSFPCVAPLRPSSGTPRSSVALARLATMPGTAQVPAHGLGEAKRASHTDTALFFTTEFFITDVNAAWRPLDPESRSPG